MEPSWLPPGQVSRTDEASIVLAQIHSRVKMRDFVRIAIEGQGWPAIDVEEGAWQASLACLAPARVRNRRVYVGVEPVFTGLQLLPGIDRLSLGKADAYEWT